MAKVSFSKPEGGNMVASAPVTTTTTVPTPAEGVTVDVETTVCPATQTTTAPSGAPAPATQTATAPATSAVPAVYQSPGVPDKAPVFHDDENIDPGDLVIPHMQLVQKVGELSNVFKGGTILFDGKLVLQDGPNASDLSKPIRMLILGMRPKRFVEKCEGGLRGDMFDTEQEVVAHNGTLDYNEAKSTKGTPNAKRLFQTLLTALCLIEQPEGVDAGTFPFTFGGTKNLALALYNMKGTAYTNAAKPFMTARKIGSLARTGYRGGWWTLQSQLKKFGNNYSYIPVVNRAEDTDEAFRTTLFNSLGF